MQLVRIRGSLPGALVVSLPELVRSMYCTTATSSRGTTRTPVDDVSLLPPNLSMSRESPPEWVGHWQLGAHANAASLAVRLRLIFASR